VEFALDADDLRYFNNDGRSVLEPGKFAIWMGGDSSATLGGEFELTGEVATEQSTPAVARAPKNDESAESSLPKQPVRVDSGT
jgi:hypothetical protein